MTAVRALFTQLERIATLLAFVAGVAVLVLSVLITVDIVARRTLGYSLQATDELGGYTLAMVGSLGMAHVLARREFTRVDLIFRYLPLRAQRMLNVAAYVSLAGVVVFFAYHALVTLEETRLFQTRSNSPLQTPLWIPQGLWAGGMCFFAFMAVLLALRAVLLLIVDPSGIDAEYAATQIEDEVEAYTAEIGTQPGRKREDT